MKNQALFSLKDRVKKFKHHLQQYLFGALRVKLDGRPKHCITKSIYFGYLNKIGTFQSWNFINFSCAVSCILCLQEL